MCEKRGVKESVGRVCMQAQNLPPVMVSLVVRCKGLGMAVGGSEGGRVAVSRVDGGTTESKRGWDIDETLGVG